MPPKKKVVNMAAKEKTISLETAKSGTPRRSSRYSSKNEQDTQEVSKDSHAGQDNHEKTADSENMKSDARMKRKADALVKSEKPVKSPKVNLSTVKNEDTTFSPRRSSRGVIPNRRFKDMEVEFTIGRKQVIKAEEDNKTPNQSTPGFQNKQKLDTRTGHAKRKRKTSSRTNTSEKDEDDLPVEPSTSTEIDIVEDDKNDTSSEQTHDIELNNETPSLEEDKREIVPNIKIIKFDQDNNMQITDFNSKDNPEESDTPDFSIIREEDLEKITSELLELAQNAEQEHNELQQIMFKDSAQSDKNLIQSADFTITPMKVIEICPATNNDSKNDSSEANPSVNSLSDSIKDNQNSASDEKQNTDCSVDDNSAEIESNPGTESIERKVIGKKNYEVVETVVVENIMQKTTSRAKNDRDKETEGSNETDDNTDKEKDSSLKKGKVGKDNIDAEFTRADVIPISFEDSEIQIAVQNALLELTEKTAENEENTDSDTEKLTEKETKEENMEKVMPENVSSSGTQTAAEGNVIKLPAINVKSKNGPLKTLTIDQLKDGLQIDESNKKGTTSKQEFIVVHVPDGQVVKRSTVRVNKPEDCIPFNVDEDGVYHCGLCNYSNDKRINLYKHRKKHVDDKPHCCPYCKYRAATSSNLKRHISIHQDVRNFRCHLCNTTFRQKIHLERHIRYRHEEKKVKCPLCDYVCANENPDLKIHMKRRHLPQDGEDGSIAAFKCNECDLVTVNKKDFKQHMKFHRAGPELKLFCEYCSFVTDCESRLRRHSYIHTREKPFKCGMCEYRASQKEHVIRHMRSQHGIEIEKRSRRNDDEESLDGSIDSREESSETKESSENKSDPDKFDYSSQEKIFACNHCSMKFAKLINLYKHLHAQHKEILPEQTDSEFLCVVCDFKTTTKKNLLVHMRKHNQIDQIPPSHVYSCVLCNYINPKRRNLFQHMKKKHGIEIVMKDDGSTSCFVTDGSVIGPKCDETVQNILTIGDVVTTETEEHELQIVTDDLEKDGIPVQNVISFDDIAYAVSHPQPHNRNLIVVEPSSALIQEHEAAEAIEGLQALAEQPGIITCPEVISEITPQLISVTEEEGEKPKTETEVVTMETENVQNEATEKTENEDGIQISADEVMQLSAGDYVEINGEMYKVEISESTGVSTEVVTST